MIDFNREPSPKTEEEKAFDALNEQYEEKFGTPYVFAIGVDGRDWPEVLEDIRRRIEQGEPQPEPEYQQGDIY